ncbi:MAG: hydrogenase maturation peptidase HycI [Candidatus Heimdallarchaeota archaeon]
MKYCSSTNTKTIENSLQCWFSNARKVVIAGIGSLLRKDDFVGVKIVRNLQEKDLQSVYLIECETVPENFIKPIREFGPTHVLIIDAAQLNLPPGTVKLLESDAIAGVPIITHALPLHLFCEYLEKVTGAKVALLAIQPKEIGFGEGLTSELKKTANALTNLLLDILS